MAKAQELPAEGQHFQGRALPLGVLLEDWHHCLSAAHPKPAASGLVSMTAPGLRKREMVPYREEMWKKAQRRLRSLPCQDGEKLSQHQKLWARRARTKPAGWLSQNLGVQNAVRSGEKTALEGGERPAASRAGLALSGALGGQVRHSSL